MRRGERKRRRMGYVRVSLDDELQLVRSVEGVGARSSWFVVTAGVVLALVGISLLGAELVNIHRQRVHREKLGRFLREKGLSRRFLPKVRSNEAMDLAGGAASCVGLVLLVAGWDRRRTSERRARFRVGQTADSDYVLGQPFLREGWVDLLKWKEGRWEVNGPTGSSIRFLSRREDRNRAASGSPVDVADDGAPLVLDADRVCLVDVGPHRFELSLEERPVGVGTARPKGDSVGFYVGSLVVHGGLLAMLFALPGEASMMNPDSVAMRGRFQRLAVRQVRDQAKSPSARRKPRRPPVKVADRSVRRKNSRFSGPVDERIKRPTPGSGGVSVGSGAGRKPSTVGIVGALGRMNGKMLSSVFARDSAISSEAEQTLGSLVGNTSGDTFGIDALGLGGPRGGGPSGSGAIGLGTWGSPFGPGTGGGTFGPGTRGGGYEVPGHKKRQRIVGFSSHVQVSEGVSPAIIRRVVRRHLSEVRYCFVQYGLAVNPKASGRVKVRFSIDRNGRVVASAVVSSSMHLPAMERCIARAVRRWRFPRLGSSVGMVLVGYPFIFHAPNQ